MPNRKIIDAETGDEEKSVVLAKDETGIVSLTSAMSSADLRKAVKLMNEQRKIISKFISENLVEGTDYGSIEGETKSGRKFVGKPTLFKPGMEKILSLFGLASELEKDTETLEMLANRQNVVAYKCIIMRNGQKIAEGRGAATVGDMGRDVNSTIKIAEKRARMDACLSLGFSEYFTQDMDDPDYKQPKSQKSTAPAPTKQAVTDKQRKMLFKLMNSCGINDPEEMKLTLRLNGYPDSTKLMERKQASEMIDKLVRDEFARPHGLKGYIEDPDLSDEAIESGLGEAIEKLDQENQTPSKQNKSNNRGEGVDGTDNTKDESVETE